MTKPARFTVDPKLASLLSEGYRSSEEALRELVDNGWDADAAKVTITMPGPMETTPIVIADDGSGMTQEEVRSEYLRIASDRTSRKGDRSAVKGRKVKGRKGIGKFAGLMAASEMTLETWVRGWRTCVTLTKEALLAAREAVSDLEAVDLLVSSERCDASLHGTRVTLTGLNQKLEFPSVERLRALLVMEYGRQNDFRIDVNGTPVALDDVPGKRFEMLREIAGIGPVTVRFTISDEKRPLREPGIIVRVNGKLVGRPLALGLDEDEQLPRKLLRRVYGEIEADGLAEHVTADWGAIIENSLPMKEVREFTAGVLREALGTTFKAEVNLAKARFQKEVKRRLAELPEHRRKHAEEMITKILARLYGDAEDRIEAVVAVALDAFEVDDYWYVLKQIDEAARGDVARLAAILDELGLVDVALVAHHTKRRLAFLDEFDLLVRNAATREDAVHRAVANNLWLLGASFRLIASNKTLQALVQDWLAKAFPGKRAARRPDLFLAATGGDSFLLIEFKRPSHAITRDDENQAVKYRDDIQPFVPEKTIKVLLVGGSRAVGVATRYSTTELKVETYAGLASQARDELTWMLSQASA